MPKVKAAVCPDPQAGLSQSIAFGAVLEIAYTQAIQMAEWPVEVPISRAFL
jgi:hypothetical protein